MRRVWLASYPKSGSTWFRMLVASLAATDEQPLDINRPAEPQPLIALRKIVDDATLIDSSLLTHEECDRLRARVYPEALALYEGDGPRPRFYKVHEAYLRTRDGDPVLGRGSADAAILIVRDPRDVAVSLAAHFGWDLEAAIAFMRRDDASLHGFAHDRRDQFRQFLLTWSAHAASWLDQHDIPVHVVRYESLLADTAGTFLEALTFARRTLDLGDAKRAAARASFTNLQAQERERGFAEGTEHGSFFRKGRSGGWRTALTAEQAERIERDHAEVMRRLGYLDGDPGGCSVRGNFMASSGPSRS